MLFMTISPGSEQPEQDGVPAARGQEPSGGIGVVLARMGAQFVTSKNPVDGSVSEPIGLLPLA